MRKLLNINEKRELCTRIATFYQQKEKEGQAYGNVAIPDFRTVKADEIDPKEMVKHMKTSLAIRNVIIDSRGKNEEYNNLAKSKLRIYFIRISKLRDTLSELEENEIRSD